MTSSRSARILEENREQILSAWERRARRALTRVQGAPSLILRDYLLDYIERTAAALQRVAEGMTPTRAVSDPSLEAAVHGRLRAATPAYDLRYIITEYRILREIVRELLESQIDLSQAERDVLVLVTDQHSGAAVQAFADSVARVQGAVVRSFSRELFPAVAELRDRLRMLEQHGGGDRSEVDLCLDVAERLLEETDALARSVQVEPGQMLQMDFHQAELGPLLEGIVTEARLTYGDWFDLQLPEQPVRARFSRAGLERALENLIDNAIRQGQLAVRLELSAEVLGDEVVIRLRHQGEPLSREVRQRLTGSAAHRRRGGSGWGLGLSLVVDVVEAHGGRIEVRDEAGGSTVLLRLPTRGPGAEDTALLGDGRRVSGSRGVGVQGRDESP